MCDQEERQARQASTIRATGVHPVQVSADWEKPETTVDSPRNVIVWGGGGGGLIINKKTGPIHPLSVTFPS